MSQEYTRQDMDENYRSGVEAGKLIRDEELAKMNVNDFCKWWNKPTDKDEFGEVLCTFGEALEELGAYEGAKAAWAAKRTPLLAKIELQEKQITELKSNIRRAVIAMTHNREIEKALRKVLEDNE